MTDNRKATLWEIGLVVTLGAVLVLMLSGCAATSGARWYNPATWFSGSEGRSVARTEAKLDTASSALLGQAQRTAHETQLALAVAPESRPVEVARESNDTTVSALDQLAGPLTIAESNALRAQVTGLLSEVATERASAEKARAERRDIMAEASATIDQLTTDLAAKNKELKAGFERENAMANSYRNTKLLLYGALVLAAVGYAGLAYLRLSFGGIPQAVGRGLSELRMKSPEAATLATQILDTYLNRDEQRRIANGT